MRPIWKGSVSFGLVNIPIRLYSASKARELKFKLLHDADKSEIRYARICKEDGKEIPWEHIVKGYEYKPGDYVILTDEDFDKANVKLSKTVEITDFTKEDEIDPMLFDTPYYLEPEKGAASAYNLLRDALKKSKKVAIGHYVLRQHEHIGIIKPHGDVLVLLQLRYNAEVVDPKEIKTPKEKEVTKKELDLALKLIDQLTTHFNPKKYKDRYTEQVKEIIAKKSKGIKTTVKKAPVSKSGKVHDIMSLLKESLEKNHDRRKIA